ncbi:3-deoxy-D-manno-octulosonate 8-phosphate phosphatase [hydrothermal vent metagenome]|uniref:3-deoxy-D-manno-octulosonate 8-phosphate phosphatase n=1 Tax=hydrothermal vent metagenome TaxID=652676 RepID=A0A3B1E1D3_9ZZZZ
MIELIILDVDGTLTDGKIIYTSKGDELKNFDVKDGLMLTSWTKKLGKKAAIITGRTSNLVERRAKDLGITYLYQGVDKKCDIIDEILKKENLKWNQTAIIGDDLNDLTMLKKAGISFAPNNASLYIKNVVNIVCNNNGGDGAVRQMIEHILKYDDIEEEFLKIWE